MDHLLKNLGPSLSARMTDLSASLRDLIRTAGPWIPVGLPGQPPHAYQRWSVEMRKEGLDANVLAEVSTHHGTSRLVHWETGANKGVACDLATARARCDEVLVLLGFRLEGSEPVVNPLPEGVTITERLPTPDNANRWIWKFVVPNGVVWGYEPTRSAALKRANNAAESNRTDDPELFDVALYVVATGMSLDCGMITVPTSHRRTDDIAIRRVRLPATWSRERTPTLAITVRPGHPCGVEVTANGACRSSWRIAPGGSHTFIAMHSDPDTDVVTWLGE